MTSGAQAAGSRSVAAGALTGVAATGDEARVHAPNINIMVDARSDLGDRPAGAGGSGTAGAEAVPVLWNLVARNPGFVGRADALAQIRHCLAGRGRVVVRAQDRMGGIGKTQLAVEYAYQSADEYDVVWLIPADKSELIGGHLAQLAAATGLVGQDVTTPAAVQALHTALGTRTRWLLIFDNAEDPQRLIPWLPSRGGHVVITSRCPGWDEIAAPVEVGVFERRESVVLLRQRVPGLSEVDGDRLADALGDLPLAVAQAAAVLAETGMSSAEYLDLLTDHAAELLGEGQPAGYRTSLPATATLAMQQLSREHPAAAQLLGLCAVLGPEPIPLDLFRRFGSLLRGPLAEVSTDRLAFYRAVRVAAGHGLAGTSRNGIQMHRVTQAVLREQLGPQVSGLRTQAARLLAAATPGDTDDPATWPVWSALVPHIIAAGPGTSDDPGLRTAACGVILYLLRRGEWEPARALAEQLHRQWRERLGPDHVHTLKAATELAHAVFTFGEIHRAYDMVVETLARYRRTLGDDHPDTLRSAHDLAVVYTALGRFTEGFALADDNVQRSRRVLGNDHPSTLFAARALIAGLLFLGRHDEAATLGRETVARSRLLLGEDHPDTVYTATTLSSVLVNSGAYTEAHAVATDTLARACRVLGDDHLTTLRTAGVLSLTLRALGRYADSYVVATDTFARTMTHFGKDHPDTYQAAFHLAECAVYVGDFAQAEWLASDALARTRRSLGEDHPQMFGLSQVLVRALGHQERAVEARQAATESVERSRRTLGPEHPATLLLTRLLSDCLQIAGEKVEALMLAEDTLARSSQILGDNHPETLNAAQCVIGALHSTNAFRRGRDLAVDTFARARDVLGVDHPETIAVTEKLAVLHAECGQLFQARGLIDDALKRSRRVLGDQHFLTGHIRENRNWILGRVGGRIRPQRSGRRRPG